MGTLSGAVAAILLAATSIPFASVRGESSLLERVRSVRQELQRAAQDQSTPLRERLRLQVRIGEFDENSREVSELSIQDSAAVIPLLFEHYLRQYRFERAAAIAQEHRESLIREHPALWFRWLFIREDLPAVDKLSGERLSGDSSDATAEIARGELAFRLLNCDEASIFFSRAQQHAAAPEETAEAVLGMAKVFYKKNEYQRSLDTLGSLIAAPTLNEDVLFHLGSALIFLSRVSEAMDIIEEILHWNPSHELAHYYLGNGYARLNYSQLERKYGDRLADSLGRQAVRRALGYFNRGRLDSAAVLSHQTARYFEDAALPQVVLGSLLWSDGRFDSAAACFRRALTLIPEYGRAHNGLAKSLEGLRMRWNVNRAADSANFAKKPFPQLPGIEQFVVNWFGLSERHQKQVALSVEPWRLYLPALIECGSRYYIKPLHETLSEGPNLSSLRDLRIDYDSRLWDDVRGCGGFTTVTGIEDVERSIYFNYNTVLHELTHQVHGMFPPDDIERILDTWHQAVARDRETPTLMSRYQAASEWEYFAEGANAYFSPRRNEYDTREIVRERLVAMDSTLVRLVERYLPAPNLAACYPVGYVNAAGDATEKNDLPRAVELLGHAYQRDPRSESVLAALSHTHSLLDHDSLAMQFADSLALAYPAKAQSYRQQSEARFFTGGDAAQSVEILNRAQSRVDSSERKHVWQALGLEYWHLGDYPRAADCFRQVLAEVPDDPAAWWGLGKALGESRDFASADSAFQKALSRRSGNAALRLDYARMLLRAGRIAEAETQVAEAAILAPDNEEVWTYQGWLAAQKGEPKAAIEHYNRALDSAPYLRLPQILKLAALRASGQKKAAKRLETEVKHMVLTDVPEWVYVKRTSSFVPAKTWPHYERTLLEEITYN